jgi:hypothetical protein
VRYELRVDGATAEARIDAADRVRTASLANGAEELMEASIIPRNCICFECGEASARSRDAPNYTWRNDA